MRHTKNLRLHMVVNYDSSSVRQVRLDGRDYLVAPLTMIVPGVLSGSRGRLLYPAAVVANSPQQWEGIPLTAGHPRRNGDFVPVQSPGIAARYVIGAVRNATLRAGALVAEGWFDIAKLKSIDPRVLRALQLEEPIELSTGMSADIRQMTSGTYNGRVYDAVVDRIVQPDHLAVLMDEVGACSLEDGCGVLAR